MPNWVDFSFDATFYLGVQEDTFSNSCTIISAQHWNEKPDEDSQELHEACVSTLNFNQACLPVWL